jgi:hypothetical protein
MKHTLNTIFKNTALVAEPKESLGARILAAIAHELEHRMRREQRAAYTGMVFSAIIAAIVGLGYGGDLLRSDFWSLMSLAFSDAGVVAGYWDSFLYSLLETFPTMAVAAFMLPVFVFLISLGVYSRFRQDADRRSRYSSTGHLASVT